MPIQETVERPWYRQFWPWFIIALPAASVIAGLLTLYIAGGEPSMVVDDYGRIAMATQQRAERARQAELLQLSARIAFAADTDDLQRVTVTLTQRDGGTDWSDGLLLQLVHPTREDLDRTIELTGARGHYAGRLERPPGRYYVALSDAAETWRLTGELPAGSGLLELGTGEPVPQE